MRCAIYFIPPADDPLTETAARWLRRDPYTGAGVSCPVDGLTEADHAFLTALPRRYGFHATLKAPFRLAEGKSLFELQRGLDNFCSRVEPIRLKAKLALVENFFALVPAMRRRRSRHAGGARGHRVRCVPQPLTEIEIARRDVSRLNGRQLSNLMNWG